MSKNFRVVVDTGVVVSALWSVDGNPACVVKLIPNEIVPHINDVILAEYKEVLDRPKFDFSEQKKLAFLSKIEEFGVHFIPTESSVPFLYESDRIFYDTAKESGSILITGNTKHFPNEPFVMTPAEFINMYSDA